jgi:hypothetical protein
MTYITEHSEISRDVASTKPTHNFCSLDLLKEDWNTRQESKSMGWGANNPPGIDGWAQKTELGVFLAGMALGEDPFDSGSQKVVDEWTSNRKVEIGKELRDAFDLPETATKEEVVKAAVERGQDSRHCAASQGVLEKDKAYDGMVTDLVTSDLVERYHARFSGRQR